jgi:hypothetical protein
VDSFFSCSTLWDCSIVYCLPRREFQPISFGSEKNGVISWSEQSVCLISKEGLLSWSGVGLYFIMWIGLLLSRYTVMCRLLFQTPVVHALSVTTTQQGKESLKSPIVKLAKEEKAIENGRQVQFLVCVVKYERSSYMKVF